MYKGKLYIWCFMVVFLFAIFQIRGCYMNWDATHWEVSLYTNINDVTVNNAIMMTGGRIVPKEDMDNADALIMEHSDEDIAGYKKYELYLFSPVVMYMQNAVYNNMGCNIIDSNRGIALKELGAVLSALENGYTYADIGITDYLEGEIRVGIPNEHSPYRNVVIHTLYTALNNGEVPNEAEKKELKSRVDAILAKCINLESIETALSKAYSDYNDYFSDDKQSQMIFIGLEAIKGMTNIDAVKDITNTKSDNFMPIYFNNTVGYGYDIYIKEGGENTQEDILEVIKQSDLQINTGFRIKDSDRLYDYRCHIPTSITPKAIIGTSDIAYKEHSETDEKSVSALYNEALANQTETVDEAVIVDTIKCSGLQPGEEYEVSGTLMDKEAGKPELFNGEEATASKTFVSESSNGEVVIGTTEKHEDMPKDTEKGFFADDKLEAEHDDDVLKTVAGATAFFVVATLVVWMGNQIIRKGGL